MSGDVLTDQASAWQSLALEWRCAPFAELSVHELQNLYGLRQLVFCIEQGCAFVDADGRDERALHLAAWSDGERLPLACARLLEPGVAYDEPSIGRVATLPAVRATGLGRELMRRALAVAAAAWPGVGIRISAQSRLERFYADFGFAVVSARYVEDGIDHTEMLRPP